MKFIQIILSRNFGTTLRGLAKLILYKSDFDSMIADLETYNAITDFNYNLITGTTDPIQTSVVSWSYGYGDEEGSNVYTDPDAQFATACVHLIDHGNQARTWIDYFNILGNNGVE